MIIRPDAEDDIRSIRSALDQAQPGLGTRFATRLRDTLEQIEAMPELYGSVHQDVRATRVRKFRYVVFYPVFANRVEVLAVLHGSQDASAWQSRI
ncbi:plasmid stabilization system : Uncharacterized protein OS=Microcystis sp. T1-4 GN=MICAI_2070001 PE=4 SV=1: Plasmid_stabil [Gemmataceae bacterium]|nr:plasmid stabilization system : Uncharacterized protein OS=Microcystis sp. T1-4 GN=MICAI_2070001 PE=4 SV=1: Plasmid_stabil [Gemmataceae bacterium]VTU00549.1 plasmid stabilization system : Uncharacterized protein OS=Microcystis sp. T1-4 GN=MICAI_2070001 PE=4 SV=1: Plasmid_stabil [Gemmataceae bacterium]